MCFEKYKLWLKNMNNINEMPKKISLYLDTSISGTYITLGFPISICNQGGMKCPD